MTGKGANETVSYLEHYFKFAIRTRKINLHCDNCRGKKRKKKKKKKQEKEKKKKKKNK